jgi:hypothetical protein
MTGVALLFLGLLLTSCASHEPPAIVGCYPPAVYLQELPVPTRNFRVNADLLNWGLELEERLKLSNMHKAHLQEWVERIN